MTTNKQLTELANSLNNRGFRDVRILDNRKSLCLAFRKELDSAESVGFGGSITTRDLGLPDLAKAMGKRVWDHWQTTGDKTLIRRKQLSADLFVSAVNAITENGIIVNADGIGNRVAATIFGPKKILFIITPNKIRGTLEEAIERVRTVATPLNAKRLKTSPPCVTDMKCHHCLDSRRMDRVFVIHEYCPMETDFSIFILNEPMGY